MTTLDQMASELFTDRLHLRAWRTSDAEAHRQLWTERDPLAPHRIDSDCRPTVDDLRQMMADQTGDAQPELRLYAVERLVEGDFIGYCGHHRSRQPRGAGDRL